MGYGKAGEESLARGYMFDKDEDTHQVFTGQVKWFDTAKGYGFVVVSSVPRDILLHANVLRNYGQNSVADGSRIRIRVIETDRGIQAQEVLEILPPEIGGDEDGMRALPFDEDVVGGDLEPARVKWFDRSKGFGFANVFGLADDVFIHVEVLRRSALADLQPGEAIAIRVAEGARGRLATQVLLWETAVADTGAPRAADDDRSNIELVPSWDTKEAAE
ncbi:cold-shock protein [Palleronia abyssalis]|uniref:Cold shock protein CspD n=1 Tax=Palleronia abyssalis TaxID=1501240 RepID=A0A2R8BQM8_9RHOB|nr:cold shock domain-containing protein [Palleronia abyssalis]SPJ22459.1 Cold shock protein CspD [Palleronia abyssalis]